MGLLSRLNPFAAKPAPAPVAAPLALSMNSPEFYEMMRGGSGVSVTDALKNTSVLRCVDLVSGSMAMLPLTLREANAQGRLMEAEGHAVHRLLMFKPNGWQTPFEFKRLMQARALIHGNAYARIVFTGRRPSALLPLPPERVTVTEDTYGAPTYEFSPPNGEKVAIPFGEVLHLRDLTLDGFTGMSRVKMAADVIGTANQAQRAANRMFANGVIAGVAFEHPAQLSQEAFERLKASLESYAGADNAGRTMILEEGMKRSFAPLDAQKTELSNVRAQQVEEIGRVFGVPRPLMGVDDTSWGSGIEQLAILFVRFGLAPWMKAWEESVTRWLLREDEWGRVVPTYDERELLRGTLKDQAEFYAKALGAGGAPAFMTQNEVREDTGNGPVPGGDRLFYPQETANVAPPPA